MKTKVIIERFKRGGSQQFYSSHIFHTDTELWDRETLEKEAKLQVRTKGFTYTLEVSSEEKGWWNKYLIY